MIGNVLIKTTAATAIDCTHIEKATKILIDSAEPANTVTWYLISIDGGKWRKYSGGVWNFATEQDLTAESVLDEGNTKEELTALNETALTSIAGTVVDVAVAMKVESNAELPSISKFDIIGKNSQIKKDIIFSDVLELSKEAVGITGIEVAKSESSGGAVEVFASIQNDANEWSDYVVYNKISGKAKAIRFKAEVEADKPGVSTAILNNVKVRHWQNSKAAAIEGKSVLVTKPIELENEVNRAHAVIRHPAVNDTEFTVSVILGNSKTFETMTRTAIREKNGEIEEDFEYVASGTATSKTVTLKVEINQKSGTVDYALLGTGTGKQQSFKLPHHARPETLQISGSDDWTYKEKTDTLLVTARSGTEIKASYDWIGKTNYLTALACIFNS